MIVFIYGQDTYRSRQMLNEKIDDYKKSQASGLGLKYFNVADISFEDLNREIQQVSMFGEKKLMILTNVFSSQDFKEKFLKNSSKFLDSRDTILIYEEITPSASHFFEFLAKKAESEEFEPLTGENLKKWLAKELTVCRAQINPAALNLLIDYVGNNLWQMANEVKKLASFKKDGEIEVEDVKKLVRPAIETDIFRTIDALAQKNKKQAFFLLHQHLTKGDNPAYLLSMINYQFRNLMMVKDLMEKNKPYYSIAKTTKLHPFVVRKSYELAQKFTPAELKKIYQKIFEVDIAVKTGRTEAETALDLLIASI